MTKSNIHYLPLNVSWRLGTAVFVLWRRQNARRLQLHGRRDSIMQESPDLRIAGLAVRLFCGLGAEIGGLDASGWRNRTCQGGICCDLSLKRDLQPSVSPARGRGGAGERERGTHTAEAARGVLGPSSRTRHAAAAAWLAALRCRRHPFSQQPSQDVGPPQRRSPQEERHLLQSGCRRDGSTQEAGFTKATAAENVARERPAVRPQK